MKKKDIWNRNCNEWSIYVGSYLVVVVVMCCKWDVSLSPALVNTALKQSLKCTAVDK